MNHPWLSVLIPTYNGKKYLHATLNSILEQGDISGIECIAIDDGSSDETVDILNSYAERLPIKIVQGERRGNWVASTNYALSLATSEYVCFLHQDDLWLQDRISTLRKLIDRYPQVNLFLNSSQFIDKNGKVLGLWTCPLPSPPTLIEPNILRERLLIQNFISIPAPVFRREVALATGGLDELLWYTADWEFWLKLSDFGSTLYCSQPLTAFRVHEDSQTIVRSSYLTEFQQQMQIVVDRYLEPWQVSPKVRNRTKRIANFSIQVNTSLAGIVHGQKVNLLQLLGNFLSLGLPSWYQYFRDSRLWERVIARLKIKLTAKS